MKKKIIATCLILALAVSCLTACGPKDNKGTDTTENADTDAGNTDSTEKAEDTDDTKQDTDQTADAPDDKADDENAETPADSDEPETAASPVKLSLVRNTDRDYKWSKKYDTLIAEIQYQTITLSDSVAKDYPDLNDMINAENEKKAKDFKKEFKNLISAAKGDIKDFPDDFMKHEYKDETIVRRADSVVYSTLSNTYYFTGGVHGMYSHLGRNYDSQTGNELEIKDVVKDMDAFGGYVEEEFKKYWKDVEPFDDVTIKGYITDPETALSWTLDYYGVTVYFNPYEIAPYAAGSQTVTVSFADHPELFEEKYMNVPESYALELAKDVPVYVDITGDGEKNVITASGEYDVDDYYSKEIVTVDDKSANDKNYVYEIDAKLVKSADNRYYVYEETTSENDYRAISVFDINGGDVKFVDTFNGGASALIPEEPKDYYGETVLTDPDHMVFDTRTDLMSTISGYKNYTLGSNGMPETEDKIYIFQYELTFTAKKDIETQAVDSTTYEETGETVTLKKGDKVVYYGTDDKEYGYLKLESGKIVRVKTTSRDWVKYISGKKLEKLFDGIIFAG